MSVVPIGASCRNSCKNLPIKWLKFPELLAQVVRNKWLSLLRNIHNKRLEAGTFERPKGEKLLISSRELILILQGVRLTSVRLRKRYERVVSC
ncbi:hypothetical protein [Dyadobacter sp. 32]|uniref:hypothetical protein n=1 Tax=Dyadobacter sp. 32 TaxID=538966 RepID=UPI0039C7056E